MPSAPYIPNTDAAFATWLANFSALISAAPTVYGLVAGDAVLIATQDTAYGAAYTAATDPSSRTPVTVAAKDAARVNAEAVARPYATQISRNPAVDPGDKAAVGVTIPDPSRTPVPIPTSTPNGTLRSASPNQAIIDLRDSTTPMSKAKPYGCVGVQLWASYGTVPATDPDQLSLIGQFGKSPIFLDTAGHAGKVCTYATRYVTRSGLKGLANVGPFSALQSFFVV